MVAILCLVVLGMVVLLYRFTTSRCPVDGCGAKTRIVKEEGLSASHPGKKVLYTVRQCTRHPDHREDIRRQFLDPIQPAVKIESRFRKAVLPLTHWNMSTWFFRSLVPDVIRKLFGRFHH